MSHVRGQEALAARRSFCRPTGFLMSIRRVVEITPAYGVSADKNINVENNLELPTLFHLNSYAEKDTTHSMYSSA